MNFSQAYTKLEQCLNDYLVTKPKGDGWTDAVKAFQQNELPTIQQSQDMATLKEKTKTFCNSLRSTVNFISLGFIGSSALQGNLIALLVDIDRESLPNLVTPEGDALSASVSPHASPASSGTQIADTGASSSSADIPLDANLATPEPSTISYDGPVVCHLPPDPTPMPSPRSLPTLMNPEEALSFPPLPESASPSVPSTPCASMSPMPSTGQEDGALLMSTNDDSTTEIKLAPSDEDTQEVEELSAVPMVIDDAENPVPEEPAQLLSDFVKQAAHKGAPPPPPPPVVAPKAVLPGSVQEPVLSNGTNAIARSVFPFPLAPQRRVLKTFKRSTTP